MRGNLGRAERGQGERAATERGAAPGVFWRTGTIGAPAARRGVEIVVNGASRALPDELAAPQMPLLWALRDVLDLTGTKFGCGVAACGACTVHVDGSAVRSCVTPLDSGARQARRHDRGARHAPSAPHPLQQAWVAHQVPQCGYCQSGMLMAAAALLAKQPQAERRRHRRRDHQHLPLRHLPAHARRDQAAARAARGARSRRRQRGSRHEAPQLPPQRRSAPAGALVVGWGVLPPRSRAWAAPTRCRSSTGEVGLNGWIKIAADGGVLLAMNRSEMGQGVHTALAMLVAEELDVPLARVRLIAGRRTTRSTATSRCSSPACRCTRATASRAARARRCAAGQLGGRARSRASSASTSPAARRASSTPGTCCAWPRPRRGRSCSAPPRCAGSSRRTSSRSRTASSAIRSAPSAHYGELAKTAAATPPGDGAAQGRRASGS